MESIVSTRTLVDRGHSPGDLRRLQAERRLERVRRGAYLDLDQIAEVDRSAQARHRRLIAATLPLASPEAVLSHGSAAILHALPVWSSALERVHVSRDGSGGGRTRTNLRTHVGPLLGVEVTEVDGQRLTALARTASDLARTTPVEQGIAATDAARRQGLELADLAEAVARARGWRGAGRARRVATFADPRAESAGESVSRWRIHTAGLPEPDLQYAVVTADGLRRVCDFAWERHRTFGEFDGKVKYGRLLRPGETAADAVYREKLREDALRDLGWQVVRWTWAELADFAAVADRLQRAFARTR